MAIEQEALAAAAPNQEDPRRQGGKRGVLRSAGLGLITGAANDDCSAIGTYASAGAQLGYSVLWAAPLMLPLIVTAVYLSSKLGQVTGRGLFGVLRAYYSHRLLYPALVGIVLGNTIEAGADIGGIAAALHLFVPIGERWIVIAVTAVLLALQIWGSYTLIRDVFRILAMSLLAYIASAFLAHPNYSAVLNGTLRPTFSAHGGLLQILVAIIGTSISAYLYPWQSSEEVEEKIASGKRKLWQRRGARPEELQRSLWDVISGMVFSSLVAYFILLAAAATLFRAGHTHVDSAAQAAQALQPIAGRGAGLLFAVGIAGVGFLAVPVMTAGAAYSVCQSFGWTYGLSRKPREAPGFYVVIALCTLAGMGLNFLSLNPMHALVWAAIAQGFLSPPLLLLILRMTGNRQIMGDRVNGRAATAFGWATICVLFAATAALAASWLHLWSG
jgi:Mn2+/Fe2+ NRAMP family transporter